MSVAKKVAICGIMLAAALALAYVESLIPIGAAIGVPGVKLGLSNVAVMVALLWLGLPYAAAITVLKAAFMAVVSGAMSSLFSLAGGVLALIAMWAALRFPRAFSLIGVSVAGAVMHNIGQCVVAALTLGGEMLTGYLPLLLICGVVTGALTGLLVYPAAVRIRVKGIDGGRRKSPI